MTDTKTPIIPDEEKVRELELQYDWTRKVTDDATGQNYLLVASELLDYDEGSTYTQYVWQIEGTDVFFQVVNASNSWADYDEITSVDRVEPKTVTKVVYEAVK